MYVKEGDVNTIYPQIIHDIKIQGAEVGPRGTSTYELHPAYIELTEPYRPLVTSYGRPVNVAFALAEILWILRGRQDVEMLARYNKQITQFAEGWPTQLNFNAPYGYRMRAAHGYDQIEDCIRTLQHDPDSRQAVLTIWHPNDKGWYEDKIEGRYEWVLNFTKDRACNVMALPKIRNGKLDWLQLIRSNDAILGVPYNWMQWHHIQAYMAARLRIEPGVMNYVADSLHLYRDTYYDEGAYDVEHFDLYEALSEHLVWFPEQGEQAEITMMNVSTFEDIIWQERGAQFPKVTFWSGIPAYWESALYLWTMHRMYTEGKRDQEIAEAMVGIPLDNVLFAAQFRFYFQKRWQKFKEKDEFLKLAYDAWGNEVAHWIQGTNVTLNA